MIHIKNLFSQLSYTVLANLVKIGTVGVLTLIVPKVMNMEDYGYWQLYVFYTGYVGFLHLGWCDGIYLREGGKEYSTLNKDIYKSQFISIILLQIIFGIIIISVSLFVFNDFDKLFVIIITSLNALFCIPCTMLSYILQCTGKIKEYSLSNSIGRLVYFFTSILLIIIGIHDYKVILMADILGWIVSLFYSIWVCKDIIKSKLINLALLMKEIKLNINIGSKLMLANIASSLILGVIRISMEGQWDIVTFGKVSLSLNFCNLLLIFINAVSIVLYPILRNIERINLLKIYKIIDTIMLISLFLLLFLYFPMEWFIKLWIPQYSVSITYMAILFPICIYEAKTSLLINTYFKVLRLEKTLLVINIFIFLLSSFLSYITVFILCDINLTIFLIVFILGLRCTLSEIYIRKKININNTYVLGNSILEETILSLSFIFSAWLIQNYRGFLIYSLIYTLYIVYKRKHIKGIYSSLTHLLKEKVL